MTQYLDEFVAKFNELFAKINEIIAKISEYVNTLLGIAPLD